MKKIFCLMALIFGLSVLPTNAAPAHHGGHGLGGGRPAGHSGSMARPPMSRPPMSAGHRPPHYIGGGRPLPPPPMYRYRPYRPIIRPYYYSSIYYPTTYYSTSYTYYPYSDYIYTQPYTPIPAAVNTVIVRDDYAGLNAAANVINAASNVAATIRYYNW
ncbi:MAG: hypothetical protein ACI37Q_02840 [Candidatus Gastranaerophilaceae bacterium]